jgi:Lrp/AsnC family transcriptional regulator of ectoine degradation
MAATKLDATDLKILDAIQRDGRITKLKLAEQVGLSPTPCWMPGFRCARSRPSPAFWWK